MKKLFAVVVLVILAFVFINFGLPKKEEIPTLTYQFDFETLDKTFWLVGNFGSMTPNDEAVTLKNGTIKMTADGQVSAPYLLSKPIMIREGDVITLKRKVKISHGEGPFNAGVLMFQTDDVDLIPEKTDNTWESAFGEGVFLIEYSYDLSPSQTRPGKDIIRMLPADWEFNKNYQLIPPIYDTWYEETFVFDTRSSQIAYTINGKTYKLNSYDIDRSAIRFFIHPFGSGAGNLVEMDDLEIVVENKKVRRQK